MHLMDDAALVEAARSGDDTAWAAIYDRYADKLHDHCTRILRDRDEAADALHDAFLAASRNLHQLRDPSRLRPWMYSICRHTSLRRLKARDRVDLSDSLDEMTAPDLELERGVRTEELSALVWAAAAGLNGRDQALLDLSLRQGLEGQDLADAMGTSLNNSYVMLSRMRDQVERSLGALLIARLGRDDCDELDGLLAGWDGKFSPLLRKRVARHVDSCEICSEKRKSVVSPLALLAAAPLVPAPSLLKARVISSIRNVDVVDGPHVPFTKEGFAVLGPDAAERRKKAGWLIGVAAAVLLLGGFFLTKDTGGNSALTTAAGATSTSRATRATTPDGSTIPDIVGEETTSSTDADAGTDGDDPTDTTVKDPKPGGTTGGTTGGVVTTATTAKPTTTTIDRRGPTVSGSLTGPCPTSGQRTVTIRATATDPSGVTLVKLINPSVAMHNVGGDVYEGTFTVSPNAQVTSVIRAEDGPGNQSNLPVSLAPCTTTTTPSSVVGNPG